MTSTLPLEMGLPKEIFVPTDVYHEFFSKMVIIGVKQSGILTFLASSSKRKASLSPVLRSSYLES